jgi:type IV pilus assembly protein PilM
LAFLPSLERWIKERPPDFLFEVNQEGLACATPSGAGEPLSEAVPPASLLPSPATANVLNLEAFRSALAKLAPSATGGRKQTAGVVFPDYAARMAILDFDEWPDDPAQRTALVRFRLKKSVPFAIDEAQISYSIQRRTANSAGRTAADILAVAMDQRILKEYEGIFTDPHFRVGMVVPAGVACLSLFPEPVPVGGRPPLSLLLKLSGSILTVLLLEDEAIRLVRCVDFSAPVVPDGEDAGSTPAPPAAVVPFSVIDDTLPVLTQTLAYAEDEIGHTVDRLILSGFGEAASDVGLVAEAEFQLAWEVLHSRFAEPKSYAGLLGLLERYAA